jgi:hypothetical protein
MIHRSDMGAVGAANFHVFLDLLCVGHGCTPFMAAQLVRGRGGSFDFAGEFVMPVDPRGGFVSVPPDQKRPANDRRFEQKRAL